MVSSATGTEWLLAQKTAEEYRRKGYEVVEQAPLEFLPGFRADLIARKGDETRVIEVKARYSLAADPRIRDLAQRVNSMPGWTFELVLVGEPELLESPEGARSFEIDEIRQRIEEAEHSLGAGLTEAAFMLAWSAGEAAIRRSLLAQGVSGSTITTPGYVLDQGVYHGVISRENHDTLNRMQKYRNAIVHGFDASEFDGELVSELIATVGSIMETLSVADSPKGPTAT